MELLQQVEGEDTELQLMQVEEEVVELQLVEVGEAELLQLKQVEEVEGEHLLMLVEEVEEERRRFHGEELGMRGRAGQGAGAGLYCQQVGAGEAGHRVAAPGPCPPRRWGRGSAGQRSRCRPARGSAAPAPRCGPSAARPPRGTPRGCGTPAAPEPIRGEHGVT